MIIGVPAETAEGERRVALVPNHDRARFAISLAAGAG